MIETQKISDTLQVKYGFSLESLFNSAKHYGLNEKSTLEEKRE